MHSTGTFEQLSDSPIQGFHGIASFKEYLDTKMSFDYLFIHTYHKSKLMSQCHLMAKTKAKSPPY